MSESCKYKNLPKEFEELSLYFMMADASEDLEPSGTFEAEIVHELAKALDDALGAYNIIKQTLTRNGAIKSIHLTTWSGELAEKGHLNVADYLLDVAEIVRKMTPDVENHENDNKSEN